MFYKNSINNFLELDRCNVYVGVENQVAVDEGQGLASTEVKSLEGCKLSCTETSGCKSFAFCPSWTGCYLKNKVLEGTEDTRDHDDCTTYYPKCDSGKYIIISKWQ